MTSSRAGRGGSGTDSCPRCRWGSPAIVAGTPTSVPSEVGSPVVRPRDITIVEVSLVQWGAYERAGVTSLSVRSATAQDLHERSQEAFAWVAARQAGRGSR